MTKVRYTSDSVRTFLEARKAPAMVIDPIMARLCQRKYGGSFVRGDATEIFGENCEPLIKEFFHYVENEESRR